MMSKVRRMIVALCMALVTTGALIHHKADVEKAIWTVVLWPVVEGYRLSKRWDRQVHYETVTRPTTPPAPRWLINGDACDAWRNRKAAWLVTTEVAWYGLTTRRVWSYAPSWIAFECSDPPGQGDMVIKNNGLIL